MPKGIPPPPSGFELIEAAPPPPPPGFELITDEQPKMPAVVPGMEKLGGTPPPAAMFSGSRVVEQPNPIQKTADVTFGALTRGVGGVIEGAGGAMRRLGMETAGTKVREAGKYLAEEPEWLQVASQDPGRWLDPAFLSNLAFQGAGSTLATMIPGLGAGRVVGAAKYIPTPLLRKAAQLAGSSAVGAFLESLTDAGTAYNDAIDKGVAPEVAKRVFDKTVQYEAPATMGLNLIEFLPVAKGAIAKAVQTAYKGLGEGVEEVVQGAAQRQAENEVLGTKKSLLEGAPEEFVGGVLGGGIVHGARAVGDAVRNRMAQSTPTPAPTPVAEPALADVAQPNLQRTPEDEAALKQATAEMQAEATKKHPDVFEMGRKSPEMENPFENDPLKAAAFEAGQAAAAQEAAPVKGNAGNAVPTTPTAGKGGKIPGQNGEVQETAPVNDRVVTPEAAPKEQPGNEPQAVTPEVLPPEQPKTPYQDWRDEHFFRDPETGKWTSRIKTNLTFTDERLHEEFDKLSKGENPEPAVTVVDVQPERKALPPPPPGFELIPAEKGGGPATLSETPAGTEGAPTEEPPTQTTKETTSDQENQPRVSGEVGERKEPVETKPVESGSREAAETGGVLQEPREVDAQPPASQSTRMEGRAAEVPALPPTVGERVPGATTKPGVPALREDERSASGTDTKQQRLAALNRELMDATKAKDKARQQEVFQQIKALKKGEPSTQVEKQEVEQHEFHSTQVNMPEPIAKRAIEAGARIPDSALAENGRETEPHVTVKYGLHDEVDPDKVRKVLAGYGPVQVRLGKTSLFKNDDADVLKVDVDSPQLREMNAALEKALPNTNTYAGGYTPHLTIAYLKAGMGDKYAGKLVPGVSGKQVTVDTITFSDKNGKKVDIPLTGEPADSERASTEVEKPSTQVEAKKPRKPFTKKEAAKQQPKPPNPHEPQTYDAEQIPVKWHALDNGDKITLPGGAVAEVVDHHAMHFAPIIPAGRKWAAIGVQREVSSITVKMPDGYTQKLHRVEWTPWLNKQKAIAASQPEKTESTLDAEQPDAGTTESTRAADNQPLETALPETGGSVEQREPSEQKRSRRSRKDRASDGAVRAEGDESLRGEGTSGPGVASPSEPLATPPGPQNEANTRLERDYRIPDSRKVGGSPEKRAETNIKAIRTLRQLETENRLPTAEEQTALAGYVGWGAVPQLFAANTPEWQAKQNELRELLSDEEYDSARRSTTNAHYTSDAVVDAMWKAMQHMGAAPGMVWLEPAVGVGNFLGRQPAELLEGARRVGVDKDTITGKIAQKLYPDSGIEVTGYEKAELPDDYFDAAISNVPFGDFGVNDPAFKGKPYLTNPIHNYFFAKTLSHVRPGGVIGFITSRYTMDGYDQPHKKFREWVDGRADFLGAVRLPSNAFQEAAGTHVITDIIFLRRRLPGAEPQSKDWIGTDWKWLSPDRYSSAGRHAVNRYYHDNPQNILGEEGINRGQFSATDYDVKGKVTEEQLTDALKRILPTDAFQKFERQKKTKQRAADVAGSEEAKKVGSLFIDDKGKLHRRASKGSVEEVEVSDASLPRVKAHMNLRDTLTKLLEAELNDDSRMNLYRQKLNLEYELFVKKFGPLWSRANISAFGEDPDHPLLLSLEHEFDGKTAKKAPIFSKRVLEKAQPVDRAESAQDALMVSLNELGRIDWDRMSGLTGRAVPELQQELAGVVFEDPTSNAWLTAEEYLSGSVRSKLRQARKMAKVEPRFEANVKALEAVQPEDIPPSQIFARLGVTWIPTEVYEDFVRHVGGFPEDANIRVHYAPALGEWVVTAPWHRATSKKFATGRVSTDNLLADVLNMRKTKVYDKDKDRTWVNADETAAAAQKAQELQDEFQRFVFSDAKRSEEMARLYNDKHNDLRLRTYNGEHLTLPGMNASIKLHKHQRAAIWRVISQPNALLAHAVGAGKTFEMIAGGMELKRMGLVKRPMYVVPNATLSGWQEQFTTLYPAARILVFSEKDLEKTNRQRVMARIATGNWDAVVVPHSSFQFLPVSDALFQENFDRLAEELEEQIKEAEEGGMDTRLIKRMEKAKERLLESMEKRRAQDKKDQTVSWEQLGIDQLFVDEAHEYKKLGFATKQTNIAGIDQAGNQKTFDLRMKMQHVQRHGRGVVFATGTPITNTMGEMFSLMRYLIEPELQKKGIGKFDEWAANYGRTISVFEPKPEQGGYQMKERFAKFVNLPELITLFRSFSDVVTSDMLDIPRPKVRSREVLSQMSDSQIEFMGGLQERAKFIRDNPREAMKRGDCMLAVYGDAQKMALDIRMVDPNGMDHPGSRLNQAADNIHRIWKDTADNKSTQIVFMDLGKPISEGGGGEVGFSTYDELIRKLQDRGIPAGEIAHIYSAKTKQQRAKLFQAMNDGRIRVLIGSTPKLGVGVNVQKKLIAAHHLDLPHRPADYEQRNGRIERQGNENPEVETFTYLTQGTLDELKASTLARKAKFISAVMQGKSTVREAEDIGGMVASFEQFQAAASGDPRVMRMMEVEAEIARLGAVQSAWTDQQWKLRREASEIPTHIAQTQRAIAGMEAAKSLRDKSGRVWKIGKQHFQGEGIRNKVAAELDGLEPGDSFTAFGIPFQVSPSGEIHTKGILSTFGRLRPGDNIGTVQSLENAVSRLDDWIVEQNKSLDQLKKRGESLVEELNQKWPYQEQYQKLQAEHKELTEALGAAKGDAAAEAAGEGEVIKNDNVTAEDSDEPEEDTEESKEKPKTASNPEAGFASPELLGAHLIARGVRTFADWSREMLARFPGLKRLEPLYFRAKQLAKEIWQDESGSLDIDQARVNFANLAKAFRESSIYAAGEWVTSPMKSRMSRLGGGAGAELFSLLERTKKVGEVEAGKATWRLLHGGLMNLTREQWFNLTDAMEGRAEPSSPEVQGAVEEVRRTFDGLAASAIGLGMKIKRGGRWLPFQMRENWFPHTFPRVEELKRGGEVRKDVLENLVRIGEAKDAKDATELLSSYIEFMEGANKADRLIRYLVESGKAMDEGDALQYLVSHRENINRHGSLEHSRDIDLPFWDPNPQRVLPFAAASAAKRLAEVQMLGQNDERLWQHFARIARTGPGKDAAAQERLAREWTDRILGRQKPNDEPESRAIRWLTGIQVSKLGLSAFANAGQMMNTWLKTDTATAWGVIADAVLSKEKRKMMRELGTASGATLDPIVHEMHEYGLSHDALQRWNEKLLRWNGFTGVERWNRLIAAEAGRRWATKLHAQAKAGDKQAAKMLSELGVDPTQDDLTPNDRLMAASTLVDMVQFRHRPEDFPVWASTPGGRLLWQFKSYAYNQTRFIAKETIGELRDGNWGRGMRNLLILAIAFPIGGELVRAIKDAIMGRPPKEFESLLQRWLDDLVAMGSLGIVADIPQRAGYGKMAEWGIGPGPATAFDVIESGYRVAQGKDPEAEAKKLVKQHAPLGRVWVDRVAQALGR